MKNDEEEILDDNHPNRIISKRGWILFYAVLSVIICLCLTILLDKEYGFTLFIGVPLGIGFIWGFRSEVAIKNIFIILSKILIISLVITGLLLILKFEGGICIIMITAPLYVLLLIGFGIGYWIRIKHSYSNKPLMFSLFLINPFFTGIDLINKTIDQTVVTQIVINTDQNKIWNIITHQVDYSTPQNFFFKYGVNYPKDMQVIQQKDSLFLKCDLRNGATKLLITDYIPNSRFRFRPYEFILPIKELTFYDSLDTPHSHEKYFKINYGEFSLKSIDGQHTLLMGKTSISHHLLPAFYWNWWNQYLVNKMQLNVLMTIKENAEKK